jgi:hypothetical protein
MAMTGDRGSERAAFEARIRQRAVAAGGPAGLGAAEPFKRIDRL